MMKNIKFLIIFFLITSIFANPIFADTQSNESLFSDEELLWIKKNPTITLGADASWPPFDFADENAKHTGVSSYFLELIRERTGLNIKVTVGVWPKIVELVKEKKLDGYTCISQTPERKKYLNFTTPYLKANNGIFVKKDNKHIKNISDLKRKKIAVSRNTYLHELLTDNYPESYLYLVGSDEEAIDALYYDKVDAFVGNMAVANYIMNKKFITNFKVVDKINNNTIDMSFAIQKDNLLLFSIIQKALNSISHKERQKIFNRWYVKSTQAERLVLNYKEEQWLKNNKNISFAGDPNWLPFEAFDKNGKYIGIVSEYLKELEKLLLVKFQPRQTVTWLETIELVKKGKIDVVSDSIGSEVMKENYTPIKPYLNAPIVIVMRDTHGFVNDLSNISDKKIALISGYGYNINIKKKYPNQKFIYLESANIALEQLSSTQIDVAILPMPKAAYLIRSKGYSDLKIVGKTSVEMNLTLFVLNSKPKLHDLLQKAMSTISPTQHAKMIKNWHNVKFAEKTDYTLLYQIIAIFTLFLLVSIYFNRKLSNEIKERKRIQSDLHIEKENFKVLFEKVSDGNLIIKDTKFITANNAALKMLGLQSVEELLESTLDRWSPEFQHDGLRSVEKAKSMMEICFKKGNNRFEWVYKDIYNNEFWVDVGLTQILYEKKVAIYVVWRDISKQKKLESSLKSSELQMRTLIDNIPLHIIVSSYSGDLLLANPKTIKDYGFDEKDISEINVLDYYVEANVRNELINDIKTRGKVENKIVKLRRPSGIHSMMMSILPIKYAGDDALLSIGVDLTQRLEMEKALKEAKDKADAANRSKSEFLANMSHEIRTPMNAIIGFTELLSEQLFEPKLKFYVKTIKSASHTLLTLINDILDLSKIEAGKLEINKTPTNLYVLSDDIRSIFMISARNKNLDFIVEVDKNIPKSLLIDEIRLRQVLLNIIGNAIKFTEVGFIKLRINAFNIDNHKSKIDLEFCIKDSGIGIPSNQLEHIFKEFEQTIGQDNRKFGGTGLGLSISQRLCKMMDGKISVNSTEGKGTSFYINLYGIDISSIMDEKKIDKISTLNTKTFVFNRAKILVVDDIEDNRELILKIFENTKIIIVTANDGLEAIKQYKNEKPNLILMDLRMPNMDGYEAAQEIKKITNVPIIALTASVMEDDYALLKRENFDAYLRKPVSKYDLLSELGNFLSYTSIELSADKEDSFELSQKAQKNMITILEVLNTEIKPLVKKSLKNNNINDIEIIALKLDSLAKEFEIELFQKYSNELHEAVDSFDIINMQRLLKKFDYIQEHL